MTARLLSSAAVALCCLSLAMPSALALGPTMSERLLLAQYQELEVAPSAVAPQVEPQPVAERDPAQDTGQTSDETAAQYTWILTVADGLFSATGNVPAPAFKRYFGIRAGNAVEDSSEVRTDAPEGFVEDALAALEAIRFLANGRAGLDETGWFIEGELLTEVTEDDIRAQLVPVATPADEWRINVVRSSSVAVDGVDDSLLETVDDVEVNEDAAENAESIGDATVVRGSDISPELVAEPSQQPSDAIVEVQPAAPAKLDTPDSAPSPEATAEVLSAGEELDSYRFSAIKSADGAVSFAGNAPEEFISSLGELGLTVGEADALVPDTAAPDEFSAAATAGLKALGLLDSGQVILRNGVWLLSGNARVDTVRAVAFEILEQESPNTEWKTLILARPALEVCQAEVAAFTADNPILFPSAGVVPTDASLASLPKLAEIFELCPEAYIYVEGHTDADGSAVANLSLSIRRAEAVVDALVELGVDPSRLFAVGYGAGLPIASNSTAAGKRQNRRIVFSFEDKARPLP